MKKFSIIILALCIVLAIAGCGKKSETTSGQNINTEVAVTETRPAPATSDDLKLSEDDAALIEALGDDLNVIGDDTYAADVRAIITTVDGFDGQLIQLEGIFAQEGENAFLIRDVKTEQGVETLKLPLTFITTTIPDNTWVRVVGVINAHGEGVNRQNMLELLTVETMSTPGTNPLQ